MTFSETASKVLEQVKATGIEWTPEAEKYCDEACIQRYLRARSGDVTKAAKMITETIKWRKENGVDTLTTEQFDTDLKNGFVYIAGNDGQGRAVVMMRKRTSKIVGAEVDQYLKNLIFVVETAVRSMKDGAENWIWVLDMNNYSSANSPALSVTAATIQMLQDHYPERLGKAYIVNAPTIFEVFYGLISAFVDPVTKAKVEFVRTKAQSATTTKSGSWTSLSSWGGSWSSSSKSKTQQQPAVAVEAEVKEPVKPAHSCNSENFKPLLDKYWTPYHQESYRAHLKAVGW